jgi:hypothetical protein
MKATLAQRHAVWKLRAAGSTIDETAEVVFGHRRWRGRVERIDAQRRRLLENPEDELWRQLKAMATE